ncbi:MAG: 1-deoxy-D-xylulose-5-phosphate synthase [Candidatus Omnitrophica bacterium]|nr:1-deoxy-D-xylulose-5-phosphate synthase [Candidatus Omnitrophota bacterium]
MLLDAINSPRDLKKLDPEYLPRLAGEIRQRIIEVVSKTGGHLASSLGTVELTLALHWCLDVPPDKIVWDVGHQAYTHKILTGRNEKFSSLRQYGGLSGFPSPQESACDPFTTGHSSTAVSLALGLSCGRDLAGSNFKVVAVIGDGSLSGGLCFEGLNNAGHLKKDILIILNTNELSISPNVGALSTYLNKLISLPVYNRFKSSLDRFVESRIPKGSRLVKIANKFEEGLKGLFIPGMLFEELGFRYFGPWDGHDLRTLIPVIKNILTIKGPRVLHIITKKGKGYLPSEEDPVKFHSAAPFDVATGSSLKKEELAETYTQVFREKLLVLAKENLKIVAITAAMPEGTGLDKFHKAYPERFFDVGIAEPHAVCFSSGLAKEGFKPVVAIYSTFLQRAYDSIMECVALQGLGVIFALDRSGIVGGDGPTHQGIFDIAYLKTVPDLVIMAPCDGAELEAMLEFAVSLNRPVAIRYPKATCPAKSLPFSSLRLGKAEVCKEGRDFVIIALGTMVSPAMQALSLLEKEGLSGALVNSRFAQPLDTELFKEIADKHKFIFSAEEGIVDGGFGSALESLLARPVVKIGVPRAFITHGPRETLLEKYGLSAQAIAERIRGEIR